MELNSSVRLIKLQQWPEFGEKNKREIKTRTGFIHPETAGKY